MILLHDHKIIYLKARKVASTSFEIALSKYAGPRDIITPISPEDEKLRASLGYAGPRNYRKPLGQMLSEISFRDLKGLVRGRYPSLFFNHMAARRVAALIAPDIWQSYTKVAAVRNPWDSAISSFYYNRKTSGQADSDTKSDPFENWVFANEHLLRANRGQYMIDDKTVIDHYLRYEHFQDDILALEARVPSLTGLWDTFSNLHAKSGIRPRTGSTVAEIFAASPRAEAHVRDVCAFEVDAFGYHP